MTALDYSQGCPVARKNRRRENNDIITRLAKFGKFYCVWMSQVVQRSSKWIETKELVLFSVMVAYQTVPICSWRHWFSLWLIKYMIFSIKTIKVKRSSIALNSIYGCITIRSSELHNDVSSSSSGLIIIKIIWFYFIGSPLMETQRAFFENISSITPHPHHRTASFRADLFLFFFSVFRFYVTAKQGQVVSHILYSSIPLRHSQLKHCAHCLRPCSVTAAESLPQTFLFGKHGWGPQFTQGLVLFFFLIVPPHDNNSAPKP